MCIFEDALMLIVEILCVVDERRMLASKQIDDLDKVMCTFSFPLSCDIDFCYYYLCF